MRYFTIPEAAKFVGVNVKTMRKHVREGRIESLETPVGVKVSEEALLAYAPLRTTTDQVKLDQDGPVKTNADQMEPTRVDQSEPDQTTVVPLAAHLAALEFAERRLAEERSRFDLIQRQYEEARIRAEQGERSRLSLEFQLQKYHNVLAENAESLAEERAFRQLAESKLLEASHNLSLADPPVVNLKMATSVRRNWRQRVRSWFGFREGLG